MNVLLVLSENPSRKDGNSVSFTMKPIQTAHASYTVVVPHCHMGYKTTTDVYALRAANSITTASSGGSVIGLTEIDTGLDSINREVLLVWEVDFQGATLGTQVNDIASESGADSFTHILSLHKKDDPSSFNLDNPMTIALNQYNMTCVGNQSTDPSVVFTSYRTIAPTSTEFTSNVGKDSPLAIVTGTHIYFRQAIVTDCATPTGGDVLTSYTRIMVQRARADADTYAALLQGYAL